MPNVNFIPGNEDWYYLIDVNGVPDDWTYVRKEYMRELVLEKDKYESLIFDYTPDEIGQTFSYASIELDLPGWDFEVSVGVEFTKEHRGKDPKIHIELRVETDHWSRNWSLNDFATMFLELITSDPENGRTYQHYRNDEEFVSNGIGIDYYIDTQRPVNDFLPASILKIKWLLEESTKRLKEQVQKDALYSYFSFPEEIKIPCEQYLIYFVQFLADMNIPANAELLEENGYTLFKVVPEDRSEALGKIRNALDIYLNAASSPLPINNVLDQDVNIAAMQWQANIHHLTMQLTLSKAIIQAKDATIHHLELSNFQYQEILTKQQPASPEQIDLGVVSLKKYDGKWFAVDLPKIFRMLKRKLIDK